MKNLYLKLFTLVCLCSIQNADAQIYGISEMFVDHYPFATYDKIIAADQYGTKVVAASVKKVKYEVHFPKFEAGNVKIFELGYLMGNPYRWEFEIKGNASVFDIKRTSRNKTIVLGGFVDSLVLDSTSIPGDLHTSAFVVSFSEFGEIEWYYIIDSLNETILMSSITENDNNEIIIAGIENSISSSIYKFNPINGNVISRKYFDGLRSIASIKYKDGYYYMSGTASDLSYIDSIQVTTAHITGYTTYLAKLDSNFNAVWVLPKPYITFDLNSEIEIDSTTIFWSKYESPTHMNLSQSYTIVDFNGQILDDKIFPSSFINFDFETRLIERVKYNNADSYLFIRRENKDYWMYRVNKQGDLDSTLIIQNSHIELYDFEGEGDLVLTGSIIGDTLKTPQSLMVNPEADSMKLYNFLIYFSQFTTTGIDHSNNSEVLFYPNPAHDFIQSSEKFKGYAILTLEGKVLDEKLEDGDVVRVDNLEEGLYILKTIQGNRIVYSKFYKK